MREMGRKTEHSFGYCLVLFFIFLGFLRGYPALEAEGATGERNPFDLPVGIQKSGNLPAKEEGSQVKTGKESFPKFHVTTILISGRTRVAAINGILMQKGDNIDCYQIVDIEAKQVVLSKGKEKFMIKVDSNTGLFFKESKPNLRIMGLSK